MRIEAEGEAGDEDALQQGGSSACSPLLKLQQDKGSVRNNTLARHELKHTGQCVCGECASLCKLQISCGAKQPRIEKNVNLVPSLPVAASRF